MPLWIWGKVKGVETKMAGLIRRRAAEVKLFNTPE
jgi:GH24 family phage-related lysozyme (muramidase)